MWKAPVDESSTVAVVDGLSVKVPLVVVVPPLVLEPTVVVRVLLALLQANVAE
jgi:hypothetical protein